VETTRQAQFGVLTEITRQAEIARQAEDEPAAEARLHRFPRIS
jgi:hypothetical protein